MQMIQRCTEKLGQVRVLKPREDLTALCDWFDKWQMNFHVDKCKVKHFGALNGKAEYKMDELKLAEIREEKDVGLINSNNFKVGKRCAKTAGK